MRREGPGGGGAPGTGGRRQASWLTGVFFLSGVIGLIYQVSWQRLLTLSYGVGAVSVTLIVSVYMLGLALGALAGGRLAARTRDPLLWYAASEAALAAIGATSVGVLLALGRLTATSPPAVAFAAAFVALCAPTALMGATLPLITSSVTRLTGRFDHAVSALYFINTLGASVGAVATGYVLISVLGLDGCVYAAAVLNGVLALIALLVRRSAGPGAIASVVATVRSPADDPRSRWLAWAPAFMAGFLAIGLEVIWFRVIGVLVKDSPYAFASILSVYLIGIALGSRAIDRHLGRRPAASRSDLFFLMQFVVGVTVLATFAGLFYGSGSGPLAWLVRLSFSADLHPSPLLWLRSPGPQTFEDVYLFLDVFLWPAVMLLLPTMCMGASFPLLASLARLRTAHDGVAVGTTYFAVVAGNVAGGLVTGLVMLPAWGTERAALALGGVGVLFGLGVTTWGGRRVALAWRAAVVAGLLLLAVAVFPGRGELYAAIHTAPFTPSSVRVEEGLDAVVVTYERDDLVRNFINGQGHGYRPGPVFLAEAAEALSCARRTRRVLVIGFGAGSITDAALAAPDTREVTLVELSGSLIANLRRLRQFDRTFGDPRLRIVIDDGRRYLLRSSEVFDAILMDPVRPTTATSGNLHSVEFFELARRRLSPGGTLMVGGLEGSLVIPRTLLAVFPHVRSYPLFAVASDAPFERNVARLDSLRRAFPPGLDEAVAEASSPAIEGQALADATRGVPVNHDLRPHSEYYLGLIRPLGVAGRGTGEGTGGGTGDRPGDRPGSWR